MADGAGEKSWWERNVEDPTAAHYDNERKQISQYDTLGLIEHDIKVGVLKGAYGFGKGLVTGLVDIAIVGYKLYTNDPETCEKAWQVTKKAAIESWIYTMGTPEEKMDQNKRMNDAILTVGKAVYHSMKADWDAASGKEGKRTELLSKWTTEAVLTVASFFIGGSEIKAAAQAGKAGELLEEGAVLDTVLTNCPKAADAEKALEAEQAAQKALEAQKALDAAEAEKAAQAEKAAAAEQSAAKAEVKFKDIDAQTQKAIDSFNADGQGASVKDISLEGKSVSQIDSELAGEGGWKTDANGKQVSQDGKWTKTEQTITQNPNGTPCTPYKMTFYENVDGGVVRVKPDGMPDAKFDHMKQPHAAKYVKKDPAGGTDFNNEAFKVDGDRAIPSTPKQLELPPGVVEGTPEAEAYIGENWKTPSHIPVKNP